MVRRSVSDPQATAHQIRDLEGGEALQTSVRTVQRVFHRHGRLVMRPVQAPALNALRKQKRLDWAKRHETWSSEDWAKVCIYD